MSVRIGIDHPAMTELVSMFRVLFGGPLLPGTPSNDAIPADEMALAEVIAAWPALAADVAYGLLHTQERPVRYGYLGQVRWVDGLACAPGTPSNDDVPRDEMLLAVGLANWERTCAMGGLIAYASAVCPDDEPWQGASSWDSAMSGAASVRLQYPRSFHCGDQAAYAAGAALAIALESQ